MRTLNSALLAAQKKSSAVPYVEARARERIGGVARLTWERLYEGSETDCFHAATMPGDGSLVRGRIDPEMSQVLVQRVAAPGPGSDFGSWSAVASVSLNAGMALASSGATVLLVYVGADGVTIRARESSDHGQSFGSPTTVATASGAVGSVAAGLKSDGTALVIYSAGATVYRVKRGGGAWGSPAAWSNSVAGVTGLACCYAIDFNVVVTGSDAAGAAKTWSAIYGDGFNQPLDVWSPLMELSRGDAGSNVTFRAPFVDRADVFRLSFVEKYTGSQAYARPLWSHISRFGDFSTNTWREPVPFDLECDYGIALAHGGSYAWLSTPSGVWRAYLGGTPLDLSDDVLEMRLDLAPFDGRVRLMLRNDDGRYSYLTESEASLLRPCSQVDLSLGYVTEQGALVSSGPRFWIEGWEYDCRPGESTFTLLARDGWWLLRRWRARREYAWGAGESSVFQILSFIFARAGLECGFLSCSETLTTLEPSFAIHPGEDGLTAVQRLLRMAPDVVRMAGETAVVLTPLSGESPGYAYGSDHAILQSRHAVADCELNRVQVFGQGLMVEAFDWGSIDSVYDRLVQVHDLNLTSTAEAQDRAEALLREAVMSLLAGEIVVPVNCGQEIYDVVSVTDARAGLSAASRRVTGMSVQYSRAARTPVYQMRLRLGAV
jgi:hypothetical protein